MIKDVQVYRFLFAASCYFSSKVTKLNNFYKVKTIKLRPKTKIHVEEKLAHAIQVEALGL